MNNVKIRITFLYLMASLAAPVLSQTTPGSNITSRTFLTSDGSRKLVQRVYDDGLGDVLQEIQSFTGSTLPSVVVHHEYDEYRRRTRSWLPVVSPDSVFVSGVTIATQAGQQYDDTAPFTRTEYDGFLPSQPSAQYKAGEQWQGNGKKVSVEYSEQEGVGMYAYLSDEGIMYTLPGVKYLCTRTVDEDGCPVAEYTDFNGRLYISETSQGRTYYVYDLKGDVRFVIPPILSEYILLHYGSYSEDILDTDEMMQKYAYVYRYDNQRHCIYKKLPGCAPVYYVYDRTGACILSQDGNQRQRYEWTYSIPDRFGRPCISGVCHNNVSYSAEPLHSQYVYAEYDGVTVPTGGYVVHNLILVQQTLHSAAYYDGYSFIGHHGVPSTSSLAASVVPGFTIDTSLGRGLQTGSATAVFDGDGVAGYTYSAIYYDSRYNASQIRTTNHLGGIDVTCTSYSYTGKPQNVKVQSTTGVTGTTEVTHAYTYDDADRLASHTLSVTHGEPAATTTLTYGYDDLGRLSMVTRPFPASVDGDVTYIYDMHGWTKRIITNSFCEELFYADGPGTPCYNGNVSSMRWRDMKKTQKRGYKFTYDEANRLTQAMYGEGDALTSFTGRFREVMGYDAHGNITSISRYGKKSSGNYGAMDNLTLSYDGNRLAGVSEAAADYDVAGSFEYKRANGSQYMYDSNGSLVADKSRGIMYATYDVNNNPQQIYFSKVGDTKYVYDASGRKLRVIHLTAIPNIMRKIGRKPADLTPSQILYADTTDYLLGGSLVVRNGRVDKLLFEGGYARATASGSTTDTFAFHYYNQDHLGNNREVVDSNGSVEQVTGYYPFGAPYADPAAVMDADLQPYKYNGKELDRMHGLDTYDYGARQYNPILGRWDRMDPLCEKYYSVSPYAYCGGNPVRYIDEHGDSLSLLGNNDDIKSTLSVYNKGMGGYYQASTDANGNVTLNPNKDLDPSNMTNQEKEVYEQLNRIISSKNMTTINICNNSSDVIIGDASRAMIDIGDINKMNGLDNSSPVAALMHETNEQSFLQNPNFRPADPYRDKKAHGSALGIEHSYTGNIGVDNVFNINKDKTGFLEFRKDDRVIERRPIYNGNFK